MTNHRFSCTECEDGKVYTSRYGGNDPDVWFSHICESCDGDGNVYVEDEHDLVEDGGIVMTHLGLSPTWFKEPDAAKRSAMHERQWKAEANGMTAYNSTEIGAASYLISDLEEREAERQSDREDAYRCGA